jgi:enoyl-CoA hydratase
MTSRYQSFQRLKLDVPASRVLRITMESPGRANAADARMHHELAYVWC